MFSAVVKFTKRCSEIVAPSPQPPAHKYYVYTPLEGIIIENVETSDNDIDLEANLQSVK